MTRADQDISFVQDALPAFLGEAREQLDSMEQLLLQLEDAPQDRVLLDALFRCAHTVKGSAGIFGQEAIVAFTHHVESVLDRLREGHLHFSATLGTLLLRCSDQIRSLVELAGKPAVTDSGEGERHRAELVCELAGFDTARDAATVRSEPASQCSDHAADADCPCQRQWHIYAAFGKDCFRNGMDPLTIASYVRGMGRIDTMVCDTGGIPALAELDPESCYLTLDFELDTCANRAEIESAFSFVREDCQLHIVEPGATPQHFVNLIEALPENPRLGDILVSAGAITQSQLRTALRVQEQGRAEGEHRPIGEVLKSTSGLNAAVVDAALRKQGQQRDTAVATVTAPADDSRLLRVHADRLDAVINLLGELVIAGAGATLIARQARNGALIEANAQVGRLIEEIRNSTLKLRMVPIGETFARFRRVVRDTAAELGKEVVFDIQGGDTELDKSMVERIADPLMHLVRNALDHGLEGPQERVAAGKPRQGSLSLTATHESGQVVIGIRDNGRGISRERVLARAWERGLLEPGVRPADEDILQLIFEPGFSTAEQVTKLSGRGVGMDVVRRNIDALRGAVAVRSVEAEGTSIEIRLPLTLAIIDGFLIGVGTSRFIFPLETVVEVIESPQLVARRDAQGRACVELRGHVLPVVDLRDLYGLDSLPPPRVSIVVIQAGGRPYGVMVDALLGQHQTVIKPLGRLFRSLRGISGSSILGNGEVALIFDVHALGGLAANENGRHAVPPVIRQVAQEVSPR